MVNDNRLRRKTVRRGGANVKAINTWFPIFRKFTTAQRSFDSKMLW